MSNKKKVEAVIEPTVLMKVQVTADRDQVVLMPEEVVIQVDHAFGKHAQYKGRNAELKLTGRTPGLKIIVPVEEGTGLSDVLAAVVNQCVVTLEIVVREAEDRQEEIEQEKRKEVEEQAKVLVSNAVKNNSDGQSF